MKKFLLFAVLLSPTTWLLAQTTPSAPRFKLTSQQANSLAEMMGSQLPNIGSIPAEVRVVNTPISAVALLQEPIVIDDVYDALLRLGPYSLSCLTDELLDSRWMPDPRSEPLLGAPVIGDIAYVVLGDKRVPDLLPQLAHKKPNELRMDDYFIWPSRGTNRQRLHDAVRRWLADHRDCCGGPPTVRPTEPASMKFRMSKADFEMAHNQFSRLRVGMTPEQVLKIKGKPDAIDSGGGSPDHRQNALLGICANDHNESLAYIYFVERWANEVAKRDPLRDRYLILFFSAKGKLMRIFSNVAGIPPLLPPRSSVTWARLAWGYKVR